MASSIIYQSVAAATAVVGHDLLLSEVHRTSQRPRALRKIEYLGSAAVGDTSIDLFIGAQFIARLPNVATGLAFKNLDMFEVNALVPAGVEMRALVVDAPATNPVAVMLIMEDLPSGGMGGNVVQI